MYSENSKWIVMRKLVTQKYNEFLRAIRLITQDNEKLMLKYAQTLQDSFVDFQDLLEPKTWLDSMSSEELLFVYSFLCSNLQTIYDCNSIKALNVKEKNGELVDYTLAAGVTEHGIAPRIKNMGFWHDQFLKWLSADSPRDINYYNLNEKRTNLTPHSVYRPSEEIIPYLKNKKYQASVVSMLINDTRKEYARRTHSRMDTFEVALSRFKLQSAGLGVDNIPYPNDDLFSLNNEMKETVQMKINIGEYIGKKSLIQEDIERLQQSDELKIEQETVDRKVKIDRDEVIGDSTRNKKFVGVDVNGNPLYYYNGVIVNNNGDVLPDDTSLIDPN